jgi:hypothetical protein
MICISWQAFEKLHQGPARRRRPGLATKHRRIVGDVQKPMASAKSGQPGSAF